MKILCIGDPHIRLESLHLIDLMMERIQQHDLQPTVIVVLGDVLHTHERLHTTALNYAVKFVDFLATIAPTYVLVGNHDYCNNSQFLTENHWMNALKTRPNIHIVDKVTPIGSYGLCVPYVPVGRFQEALDTIDDWQDRKVIFAHQEFRGCHMGAIVSQEGDPWSTNLPFVISGHIHSNETLPEGVYYPGSSIQHAFGESNKNIVALVTLGEQRVPHIKEIDLELPRKIMIYKTVDDVKNVTIPKDQHKYKLVLKGNHDAFKTFQKSKEYKQLSNECKVVFKPTISHVEEDDGHMTSDNLFVTGFSEVLQKQVYQSADKYLYCTFQKIFHNNDILEEDILVLDNKDELQ